MSDSDTLLQVEHVPSGAQSMNLSVRARLAADHLPRQQVAVVLQDGHEHLVARVDVRQAVAVGDEVQRSRSCCG